MNKAASVWPRDHAQAALRYRKAAASTLAGIYPRELRCFTVGPGVACDAYAWPTPAPFLHSWCVCAASGSCASPLGCAGRRSSRLIRLSKCGNRGEDGERREDKRGPQANDRNSLEHREFSKVVVRSTLLSVSFTPAMLNIN